MLKRPQYAFSPTGNAAPEVPETPRQEFSLYYRDFVTSLCHSLGQSCSLARRGDAAFFAARVKTDATVVAVATAAFSAAQVASGN